MQSLQELVTRFEKIKNDSVLSFCNSFPSPKEKVNFHNFNFDFRSKTKQTKKNLTQKLLQVNLYCAKS